ncbi:hypothetical protein BBK14_10635 [Parafrankia soli]|uniref:TIR domain-containing protein n=1 Tax=Parafrankia soli TaxID=2599596 RepID=A0A1S1R7Z0_9ACTN|nr:TAXI family TRAP transporter solute-binding subunit [Parafrankia soli]OHV43083.1 hypothetical protein BBK14_10635 [Parafrankia soli]
MSITGAGAQWDFFVSYTKDDRPWAEWVAWQLEVEAGYSVLVEAWDFVPGANWVTRMQQGVAQAQRTIALLSNAYLRSVYGQAVWQAAYAADPLGFNRKLVPIRLEDCPRPGLLGQIVPIDLFDRYPADAARQHLLDTIATTLNGTAKQLASPASPGTPPPFPGTPPDKGQSPPLSPPTGVGSEKKPPAEPPPPNPRSRWALAALALVVVVAIVVTVWLVWLRDSPSPVGDCEKVSVLTGQVDSPYYRYGEVLAGLVHAAYPGTTVDVISTGGSAHNLSSVGHQMARCTVSIVQFTTAVDARYGASQFAGSPIEGLRSVGPLWFDLLQLVVREDSDITTADQLCSGRGVASGLLDSGTEQIGQVLFRQIETAAGCSIATKPTKLADGLAELRAGRVDAVLWAGGVPTEEIRREAIDGVGLRMLPLEEYRDAMQDEWDIYYGSRAGTNFVAGPVYDIETIRPQDYPGIRTTSTVAVPNGIVANEAADPDLVRYVAQALIEQRTAFERVLWPDGGGQGFRTGAQTVGTSPFYCLVSLHPGAKKYYQSAGISPRCPTS